MSLTPQDAIEKALAQNWEDAVKINKELLKLEKDDLEALNRLGFALMQMSEFEKAKKTYKKILSLDKYNSLALKNLNKIESMSSVKNPKQVHERVPPGLFLEEPGKTKVVQLINLAPNKVLCQLNIGDLVTILPKKHSVEIRGNDRAYYGAIPDDIAFRLIKFIAAGNTYIACVKNVEKNSISVFIRELTRGKKLINQSTFVPTSIKDYSSTIQKEVKKSIISDVDDEESNSDQEAPEE